jgi:outer membrane lipoprotein-sorting protein
MINRRMFGVLAAAFFARPATAQTSNAPIQLNAGKPAGKPPAKPFEPIAPAVALARANAYLNSVTTLIADFVQTGAGRRLDGKLYLFRPGRLRFQYAPPATLQIIADGTSVAIQDRRIKPEPDIVLISQTPLKFLLADKIDLARDTKVLDVSSDPQAIAIKIEDHATFGGTSRIKLIFDPVSFQLRQWLVDDPQGNQTLVSLSNIDTVTRPDPALFKINYERMLNTQK